MRLAVKESNLNFRSNFSRILTLLVLMGVLAACGCVTTDEPLRPTEFPRTIKNWHGMESVEFVKNFQLREYTHLVLQPLDISDVRTPPPTENTYGIAMVAEQRANPVMYGQLRRHFTGRLQVLQFVAAAPFPERTLLFRGKLLEVDPGSVALRAWVGFGTGLCKVGISGEIVDANTGEVLLRFVRYRAGSLELIGYGASLDHCVAAIAEDTGFVLDVFN